jgi:hypothetical protein
MKIIFTRGLSAATLSLLVLLSSCEKDDGNASLKDQLIGTWRSTNSYYKSYTFFEDSTFIDTSFYMESPALFRVLEVISGDYSINNECLVFSNVHMLYFDGLEDEYVLGSGTTYDPVYNVSFRGDVLVLNQQDDFKPVRANNNGIIGKWSYDKLVAVYDKKLEIRCAGGTLYGIYDFDPDLNVYWQYEISYAGIVETSSSSTTYILNDSKLTVNQWGLYNINVSFKRDHMVWLYPDRTFERSDR